MSAIEQIVVTCREQEDSTGSDQLYFYLNNNFLGWTDIQTGQTKTIDGPGLLLGDAILVSEGDTLAIYEHDTFDPNDLLLEHRISDADLGSTITLDDVCATADYTFELKFLRF